MVVTVFLSEAISVQSHHCLLVDCIEGVCSLDHCVECCSYSISIEFDKSRKYPVTLVFEEEGSLDVDFMLKNAKKN